MIATTPASDELLMWISAHLQMKERRNRSRERSTLKVYAQISELRSRTIRIDIKATYDIHHDRCRLGYCGQVTEWISYRVTHESILNRLLENGSIEVDSFGMVRLP